MNAAITLLIAIAVIILHVWLCRRSPKFWYLGGIIPLLWTALLVFFVFQRENQLGRGLENDCFPDTYFFPVLDSRTSGGKEKRNCKNESKRY